MERPSLFIVTSTVIVESDRGILLINNIMDDMEDRKPSFPSGKINLNENLLDASKRIVLETTGQSVEITELLSIHQVQQTVNFHFYAKLAQNSPDIQIGSDCQWVSHEELVLMLENDSESNPSFASPSNPVIAKEILSKTRYPLSLLGFFQ